MPSPSPMLPTMSPSAAGKRIRIIAKAMYDSHGGVVSSWEPSDPASDNLVGAYRKTIAEKEKQLRAAIKTRKVSEIEFQLSILLSTQRSLERHLEKLIVRSIVELDSTKNKSVVVFGATGESKTWLDTIKELSFLAQSLPSWDDLPSADTKDTIIRGIIAILRLHKVPGSEDLSQSHPVEGTNDATESAGHATVGGTGIVLQGDADHEEEDEGDEDDDGDEYGDEPEPEHASSAVSSNLVDIKPF